MSSRREAVLADALAKIAAMPHPIADVASAALIEGAAAAAVAGLDGVEYMPDHATLCRFAVDACALALASAQIRRRRMDCLRAAHIATVGALANATEEDRAPLSVVKAATNGGPT